MEQPKTGEKFDISEFNLSRRDIKEIKQLFHDAFRNRQLTTYEVISNVSALNNYKFLRKIYLKSLTKEK